MRAGSGKRKGSAYEREIAKTLSKWWTGGERSDIFWRASSRGRFSKASSDKKEMGQYGDIEAIDPLGHALMEVVTIEVKRGYNKEAPCNCIDRPMRKGKYHLTNWQKFVKQAQTDSRNAGVPHWLLIFKRDSRRAMIFMPLPFASDLLGMFKCVPAVAMHTGENDDRIYGVPLDEFLENVDPSELTACRVSRICRA